MDSKSNAPAWETLQLPEWLQHAESRTLWKWVKLKYMYIYNKKEHFSFYPPPQKKML